MAVILIGDVSVDGRVAVSGLSRSYPLALLFSVIHAKRLDALKIWLHALGPTPKEKRRQK